MASQRQQGFVWLRTVPAFFIVLGLGWALTGCDDEEVGCHCSSDGSSLECYDPDAPMMFRNTSAGCSAGTVCQEWAIPEGLETALFAGEACVPDGAGECSPSTFDSRCTDESTYSVCESTGDSGYAVERQCASGMRCVDSVSGGEPTCIPADAVEDSDACPEGSTGFCEDDQSLVVCFEGWRFPAASCATAPRFHRASWFEDNQDITFFIEQLPEDCVTAGKCVMLDNGNPGCVAASSEPCEGGNECSEDGVSVSGCSLGWSYDEVRCDELCSASFFSRDLFSGEWSTSEPEPADYEGRICLTECTDSFCLEGLCVHPE